MEEQGKVWTAGMPLKKWVICSRAKTYTKFSGTKSTECAQELPRLISLPCKALLAHQRLETILRLIYLGRWHFVWPFDLSNSLLSLKPSKTCWPFWLFIPSSRKDVLRSGQCHLLQLCLWQLSRRPKGTESSGPCPAEIAVRRNSHWL